MAYLGERCQRGSCFNKRLGYLPIVSISASLPRQETVQSAAVFLDRRALVMTVLVGAPGLVLPPPAAADSFVDALRAFARPDVSVKDALVILLDAKSTLREIQGIAATPADSQERIHARAFWPSYAKRLRAVAEAAPVVARVVTGASDKEETLSKYYGGKAQSTGVADTVYQGLGCVLTISGRTIKAEAQATPDVAAWAEQVLDQFLQQVPNSLLAEAQQFRRERLKSR
nr:hypothetical protein [Volvox africanus]